MFKNSNPTVLTPTMNCKAQTPRAAFAARPRLPSTEMLQCCGLLYQGTFQRAQGETGLELSGQGLPFRSLVDGGQHETNLWVFFYDKITPCSTGWPRTHALPSPASASQVQGLQCQPLSSDDKLRQQALSHCLLDMSLGSLINSPSLYQGRRM